MSHSFALLVPVKTLTLAKSRLEMSGHDQREPLMRAFALDALAAASGSARVAQVYVVTDEPGFEVDGAVRLPDEGAGDLNRALQRAFERVRLLHPGRGVAAMCADLPCLSSEDLDTALGPASTPRWFVADAAGSGTTLLAAGPRSALEPHFGEGSARSHEASGAAPLRGAVTTLRMDVDTGADLAQALNLGVGAHTARALGSPGP